MAVPIWGAVRVEVYRVPASRPRVTDRTLPPGTVVARPLRGETLHGLKGTGRDMAEALVDLMCVTRGAGHRVPSWSIERTPEVADPDDLDLATYAAAQPRLAMLAERALRVDQSTLF